LGERIEYPAMKRLLARRVKRRRCRHYRSLTRKGCVIAATRRRWPRKHVHCRSNHEASTAHGRSSSAARRLGGRNGRRIAARGRARPSNTTPRTPEPWLRSSLTSGDGALAAAAACAYASLVCSASGPPAKSGRVRERTWGSSRCRSSCRPWLESARSRATCLTVSIASGKSSGAKEANPPRTTGAPFGVRFGPPSATRSLGPFRGKRPAIAWLRSRRIW
jgi:hypothetical protein